MRTIQAKERQTLFDIALQECGDMEVAFDIARKNDISISTVLDPGTMLQVPEAGTGGRRVADYYAINRIVPATGMETAEPETDPDEIRGIDESERIELIDRNVLINM